MLFQLLYILSWKQVLLHVEYNTNTHTHARIHARTHARTHTCTHIDLFRKNGTFAVLVPLHTVAQHVQLVCAHGWR